MLVQRNTTYVKRGKRDEFVELVKAEAENNPPPRWARVCRAVFGPWDVVVIEWEFEDLAEYEAFWEAWTPSEGFWEKYNDCTARGGSSELWVVV